MTTLQSKFPAPWVMKLMSDKLIHKSDHQAVLTTIETTEELFNAWKKLKETMHRLQMDGTVIVQPQLDAIAEIVIGGINDPQFGPFIMVGSGGKLVELLDDVVFHIAPLSFEEAIDLINTLKVSKLLKGYRGESAVSINELAQLIVNVGKMMVENLHIKEFEINPVMATREGFIAVDIRGKI